MAGALHFEAEYAGCSATADIKAKMDKKDISTEITVGYCCCRVASHNEACVPSALVRVLSGSAWHPQDGSSAGPAA
jgi:hypothetical protein